MNKYMLNGYEVEIFRDRFDGYFKARREITPRYFISASYGTAFGWLNMSTDASRFTSEDGVIQRLIECGATLVEAEEHDGWNDHE